MRIGFVRTWKTISMLLGCSFFDDECSQKNHGMIEMSVGRCEMELVAGES